MSQARAHPFPPVVRWAVFPALAALAGAAGGTLAAAATGKHNLWEWATFTSSLSAGAAFGAVLSRRPWLPLLATPVAAILMTCSAYSVLRAWEARSASPWELLRQLLRDPHELITMAGYAWLQAAAHFASLHPRVTPSWPRCLGLNAGAATLAAALGFSLNRAPAFIFFLSTALQVLPLRASLALAQRLHKY